MSFPTREPHLLRFRLRQMLFAVAVISVLCTLLVRTEGPWPLIIIVVTSLVAAHVFGTVVGNRLRDTSRDIVRWRSMTPGMKDDTPLADLKPSVAIESLVPQTTLADRGSVSRWSYWFVIGGAALSAGLGGTLLWLLIGSRIGWAGWVVGTISCAVLGTWIAFLAASFTTIARHAWRHASQQD